MVCFFAHQPQCKRDVEKFKSLNKQKTLSANYTNYTKKKGPQITLPITIGMNTDFYNPFNLINLRTGKTKKGSTNYTNYTNLGDRQKK